MTKIGIQTHGVNQSIMRKGLRGGGIAKRGTGQALKSGGRAALRFGGGRTDLLEELGRVEGEHSNRNRRAEIARVHSELNRGYAKGGRAGFSHGNLSGKVERKKKFEKEKVTVDPGKRKRFIGSPEHRALTEDRSKHAEGGRIGFKKGTDKKWIQKVNKSIKKRGTKGKCTPITKKGCTGRAKALAKTFKKMAAKRKA